MSGRNASASAFGWDFQANSAILLMLENIKDAKRVRVEGADEDIEITLQDQTKMYVQAKAVEKPDDTSHVIDKLTKALETLSDAAKNGDGSLFTYVTNSSNPFNNQRTLSYFTGRTHLSFDELPDVAQNKINEIIQKNEYTDLDVHKLDVRVIPFYGNDLKNRYKEIQACVNEFLAEMNVDVQGISTDIMGIWQKDLFQNATQSDTTISISKEKMIWPLIVLVVDKTAANEYKTNFDDDEIGEIEQKKGRSDSRMRIDNKLGLTSSAEHAMHKYLFEDIFDFLGTVTRKRLMAYLGAADANAKHPGFEPKRSWNRSYIHYC